MPQYKRRPNGAGTAVKRGKTYQARVVSYWYYNEAGKKLPHYETKDGFKTRHEAWAYCKVLSNQSGRPQQQTFLQVFTAWEPQYATRVTASTMDCYKAAKKHFLAVHACPMQEITIDQLQACVDKCGQGKRTRENMKALAGLLYKYAIPRQLAALNIATYLHTGENDKESRIPFTEDQIEIVKAHLNKVPYADYIYTLIYTGFRPTELLSLKLTDYDSVKKVLVGGIKSEAGKDRSVTVSPKIIPILDARVAAGGKYLFPGDNGKQMKEAYFRTECFYPALDLMGLGGLDLVPYSCRHSFSNFLKNTPGSDTDKAALMGHTNANMTKYYQSADLASLQAITDHI